MKEKIYRYAAFDYAGVAWSVARGPTARAAKTLAAEEASRSIAFWGGDWGGDWRSFFVAPVTLDTYSSIEAFGGEDKRVIKVGRNLGRGMAFRNLKKVINAKTATSKDRVNACKNFLLSIGEWPDDE